MRIEKTEEQPNIIYILGDDHRADFLGIAGHPVLKTPHLDQLAREGVYFENAFCTSPVCTPSRCGHYLGQWERTHGVNFNSGSSVSPSAWEKSFPGLLKKAGYFLGWVGKNHVPAGNGGYDSGLFEKEFDYWYGNHEHTGFYPKEGKRGKIYGNAASHTQVEVFEEGVMNFLEPRDAFIDSCTSPLTRRPKDKPFCLCLTFNLPHDFSTGNMELRPEDDEIYKSLYRDQFRQMPLPETFENYIERETRLPKDLYCGEYLCCYDYVKFPDTLAERQVRYCQTITGMDRMIGHLREKLSDLGLEENTIIIFSTDHGLHHGEHGLGGKCFLYEEDLHIPLIIHDPRPGRMKAAQKRGELAAVPDLGPTVLEMAGLEIPPTMQGQSLLPLVRDEKTEWREELFTEQLMDTQNYPRSESIRSKDWKYIRYFRRKEDPAQEGQPFRTTLDNYITCLSSSLKGEKIAYEELFDLRNDPGETTNLAYDAEHEDLISEFRLKTTEAGLAVLPPRGIPDTVKL